MTVAELEDRMSAFEFREWYAKDRRKAELEKRAATTAEHAANAERLARKR